MTKVPPPRASLNWAHLSAYPKRYEANGLLKDGTSVFVRPLRPDDRDAIVEFHGGLSRETVYLRFFSPMPHLEGSQLERLMDVDYADRMALLVLFKSRIVAVGRYARVPGTDQAEVAFTVGDPYQGRGAGTLLLERLAGIAREHGFHSFVAEVLPENERMLRVFLESGLPAVRRPAGGAVHVVLGLDEREEAWSRVEARDQVAVASSLRPLFQPGSVAVIGAGRKPGSFGHELFANLLRNGFRGPVYAVNREAGPVASVAAYPALAHVPGPVDLALVAVPREGVPDAVRDCAAKGVRAVVVISAGFAETGPEGRAAQDEIARLVRAEGMRMVGPNCMGVINTDPEVRLAATFAHVWPPEGTVAMSSQSGALGITILNRARELGLGISSFVAIGNKADVSSNDLIQWWERDPRTSTIILYLESFGNPRRFSRLARRVAAHKPIVAVKAARSESGARAAASHTAAAQSSEAAVDALFAQAGVIRTETLAELFDVAMLLASQPVPRGPRVAILTNGGGLGVLAADACEANGLQVPTLSGPTAAELRECLPAGSVLDNPVDMLAGATAAHYRAGLAALLRDPGVDAVIAISIPPLAETADAVAAAIAEASREQPARPVVTCLAAAGGVPPGLRASPLGIPNYAFPEAAALALARAARYGAWRREPAGVVPDLELDRDAVRSLARASGEGWMAPGSLERLLALHGLRFQDGAPGREGCDAFLRVVSDPTFGPLVAFGLKGAYVELFQDVAYRITPITDRDAREMLRGMRGYPLLEGWGGRAPVDIEALQDAILRVSAMVESIPELAEMELDPLRVLPPGDGVLVLGAKARLESPPGEEVRNE